MCKRIIFCLCLGALLALAMYVWYFVVGEPKRIIARTITPDGGEWCITQLWNIEGYETRVYYRRPGSPWDWFWYDHQDRYWDAARIEIDPACSFIVVYRDERPMITFDYRTRIYSVLHMDNHFFTGMLTEEPWGEDSSEP